MNNITKYNLKTAVVSTIGLILLLSVLSYLSAPSTKVFEWSSINPISILEGFVFALSWVGVPVPVSIVIIGLLCMSVWLAMLWMARRLIK